MDWLSYPCGFRKGTEQSAGELSAAWIVLFAGRYDGGGTEVRKTERQKCKKNSK